MRPQLLISVRDVNEACIAVEAGADLIDLKEPDVGALGAVDLRLAREIVAMVSGRRTTSATVGDLPANASILSEAARRTASSGVDFVKIGFIATSNADVCVAIRGLAPVAHEVGLIAVIFADALPTGDPVAAASAAGFAGIMIDTAEKRGGRLVDHLGVSRLREFVISARAQRLMCGLAGSLRHTDIAALAELGADYLGFRGAGCIEDRRGGQLDAGRIALLRRTLDGSVAGIAGIGNLVPIG